MKSIKVIGLLVVFGLLLSSVNAQRKIRFPEKEIAQFDICRQGKCEPGSSWGGNVLEFSRSPYKAEVADEIDSEKVALQLLGQTFDLNDFLLSTLRPCSDTENAQSPFLAEHITRVDSTSGTTFTYVTGKKIRI